MADAHSILAPLSMPDSVKADAWDAYQQSKSSDDLAARLKKLPMLDSVRADLWDAKNAEPTGSPRSGFGGFLDSVRDYASELNPLKVIKGAADTVRATYTDQSTGKVSASAPGQLVMNVTQRNLQSLHEAQDSWSKGNYSAAALHAFNYVAPFGSALDDMLNDAEQGHVARSLGKATAFGLQMAAPGSPLVRDLVQKIPDARVLPRITPNPVETAAVDFGRANDIPVSAAVATGNKFVAGAQAVADHSPIGSIIAQRSKAAEGAAFERVGGQLADQVHPNAVAPAQAGRDVTSSLEATIAARNADANNQYATLRDIEADPANIRNVQVGMKQVPKVDAKSGQTIPGQFDSVPDMQDVALPVDLRPVKAALKPVYDQIMRQLPITQQRASAGIKALENILSGPDAAPVSQVDMDLGTIKAAARGADLPQLKTLSQGLAARAVGQLHDAVSDAVGKAERTTPAGQSGNAAQANPAAIPASQKSAPSGADPGGTQQGAADPESYRPGPQAAGSPETSVSIPGEPDNKYAARYEVRDLADIQPSHNGLTFQPNPKYQIRNDRNYDNPANQRKIVEWSTPKAFDPRELLTDNPDASSGPPLIDSDGNALGGNGRTMILQRVAAMHPEEGGAAYTKMLKERAQHFGIDPAQIDGMKQPVLVRVIDDAELRTPESKQAAVTDFNKTSTAALTPAERAIADSRRVSADTLDNVAQRLEKLGPAATLAQAIEGRGGVEVLNKLISDGVVSPQEAAGLGTESALTKAGKDRISQLMLGRFFRDPDQLDNLAASVRNKVERLAAPLVKIEAEGDFSLTPHVQSAIDLVQTAAAHDLPVDDYLNQAGLFARDRYSPEAIELAKALKSSNPNALTAAVNKYGESAKYAGEYQGPGMFGDLPEPHTPRSAFNDAFGTRLPAMDAAPAEPAQAPAPSAGFSQSFAPPAKVAAPPPRVPGIPAGREAMNALGAGRAATAAKYDAAGVLKSLPKSGEEGRQVFDQAIWSKDAGIEHLRELKRLAPAEIPKIGRAFLDDLFSRATAEGGFKNGAGLQAKWQNLGPETKQVLFPNPMLRRDLDNFFLLAKRAGESPNPSGSALVGSVVAGIGYAFAHPATGIPMIIGSGALSAMLHSPAGVEALTRGLTVNAANKAAAAIAATRILRIAGSAAQPAAGYPMAAQADRPQTGDPALIASR